MKLSDKKCSFPTVTPPPPLTVSVFDQFSFPPLYRNFLPYLDGLAQFDDNVLVLRLIARIPHVVVLLLRTKNISNRSIFDTVPLRSITAPS